MAARLDSAHVRHAVVDDVEWIYGLLSHFAAQEQLLARSRDDLFEHLQEFLVAERGDLPLGVVALHVYSHSLAEIRSLAIAPLHQRQGVARQLIAAAEEWACQLGITRMFALTYVQQLFIKQGYHLVSKESLPHKVWTVCIHCDRFANCDEVAVERWL
ncbi:MAG: N-acetyltransferase [Mariprofundales bacterium]|nr:N-acetyltransferase [Mariprofundales bacterium]